MTPLERRSPVRSDGRHTETLLLSRLDRADSTSSLPLATDRDRPEDRMRNIKCLCLDFYCLHNNKNPEMNPKVQLKGECEEQL